MAALFRLTLIYKLELIELIRYFCRTAIFTLRNSLGQGTLFSIISISFLSVGVLKIDIL